MPLRNSVMCALGKNKSDIGNMLIHTSLNSFVFCACMVGDGEGTETRERQEEAPYVVKLWVFNSFINSYSNINI